MSNYAGILFIFAAGLVTGVLLAHAVITRSTAVYNGLIADLEGARTRASRAESELAAFARKVKAKL